jgi:hypothetical protein
MTALVELDAMDRSTLAALWSDLLGGPVPPKMSQGMQRRFLAHALQVAAEGDVAPALAARLDRIAAGDECKATPGLRAGARLLRVWNGTTHVVDVIPEGFLWNALVRPALLRTDRTGARPGSAGRTQG